MTNRLFAVGAVVAVLSLAPILAADQARPASPSNLPRTADGRPDLQGYWAPIGANSHSLEEGCCEPAHLRMLGRGAAPFTTPIVDPPSGRIPYLPSATPKRTELLYGVETPTKRSEIDPEDVCFLQGVPRSNYRGAIQIRQVSGALMFLYEWNHAYRVIPLNGGPHVGKNMKLWNGDSRGRWEGDTLVIDATNFKEGPWFDSHGTYYSDALHVVERLRLADADTIRYEATIEDPNIFARPWKIAYQFRRNIDKSYEFLEEACVEGISYKMRLEIGRAAVSKGERRIHTHEEENK